MLEVPLTSLHTRASDLMIIKIKYAQTVATRTDNTRVADRMHIVLHSDEIRDQQ